MMKLLFVIITIALSGYLGLRCGAKYRVRERIFSETILFLDGCKRRIAFQRQPLSEILREEAETMRSPLADMLNDVADSLQTAGIVTYDVSESSFHNANLNRQELQLYAQLFHALGKSDAASQAECIAGYRKEFEHFHEEATRECKKYGGMYVKLGVLGGAALGVLLL